MNKNLRLFYLLLFVTAVVAGFRHYLGQNQAEIVTVDAASFSIADTASVDKIFIADKDGNTALLERIPGRYWQLNGRYLARKDAVDLLLKTFLRARVMSPVPHAERDNVNRLLAGRAKKVEIYQGGANPVKTWYIGTATQNHTGTYMVLGNEQGSIADEPFIVHMEGFTGFLSTRFFTDEREWRYTGIFDFPGNSLSKAQIEIHGFRPRSYLLEVDEAANLDVSGASLNSRQDTLFWQDRFNLFRKVHLETFNNHLSSAAQDSLLERAKPAFTLRAWGIGDSVSTQVDLFWKAPVTDTYDDYGNLNEWDGARMYAVYNGEVVLVQRFVFDPIIGGI